MVSKLMENWSVIKAYKKVRSYIRENLSRPSFYKITYISGAEVDQDLKINSLNL